MRNFFYLFLILLFSCTKLVDKENYVFEPIPVLNCLLESNKLPTAVLTFSRPDFGGWVEEIDNADIYLYENNTYLTSFQYIDEGKYTSIDSIFPISGMEYSIKAFVPGFDTLRANTCIPITDTYKNTAHLLFHKRIDSFSGEETTKKHFIIKYELDENMANRYFQVNFYKYYIDTLWDTHYLTRMDDEYPKWINNNNLVNNYFSVDLLSDKHALELAGTYLHSQYKYIISELNFLSEDLYAYLVSSNAERTQLNPYAPTYSNIENGVGIFAGINSVRDTFKLGDLPKEYCENEDDLPF